MKVVDVNVLLYAINRDSSQHTPARDWLEDALNDDEPVGLPWVVLLGFLRLATSPRIFSKPLTPEQASELVETWLTHPGVKVVLEREEHWQILKAYLEKTGTAGNLTTDAHLASLAVSYGAVLASCDSDFSRFSELRWENPLAS